jgi:hypothetical protein
MAAVIRFSSMNGSNTTHNHGKILPFGSIGISSEYKSLIGDLLSNINQLQASGNAATESAGKTANNCSTGLNGFDNSNVIL